MTETLSLLQSLELCVAQRWAFRIPELQQPPLFTLGSVSKTEQDLGALCWFKKKKKAYQTFSENNAIANLWHIKTTISKLS